MDDITKRRLSQYYQHNKDGYILDDITFNDLNLDEIFEKINKTSSSLGEEVLYSLLRKPKETNEAISAFEEKISIYANDTDKYDKAKKELRKIPKLSKISVFEYLYHLEEVKSISPILKFRAIILMLIAIACCFINSALGIVLLVGVYIFNAISYFKVKKDIDGNLICFKYLGDAIKVYEKMPDSYKDKASKLQFLKTGSLWFGNLSGVTANGGSGNPLDIIIDLLKMGFWFDIIHFYSILDKVKNKRDDIEDVLVELGMNDTYLSIIDLRKSMPVYSLPKFDLDKEISIIDGVHPLIENAKPNSITTKKSILLTGSNASGKSTFLRMVAVNAVLAQTINTVYAKSYNGDLFRVISSMSITDSITNNDSYYMAEVKSLKRIISECESNEICVLSFTDELLKGTNTKERIAASYSILKYLDEKCVSLAATHDIELTKMLENVYDNYHFKEDMQDDDIVFNYQLLEGPATTQNAIKLLLLNGFPERIVDESISAYKSL